MYQKYFHCIMTLSQKDSYSGMKYFIAIQCLFSVISYKYVLILDFFLKKSLFKWNKLLCFTEWTISLIQTFALQLRNAYLKKKKSKSLLFVFNGIVNRYSKLNENILKCCKFSFWSCLCSVVIWMELESIRRHKLQPKWDHWRR